ncbi:hypothetical protein GWO18_01810 [Candidatus Bathyarchaeota archaeon]|nr:hypothetical protein [Candidatus Bathyarchaeota archaeon]
MGKITIRISAVYLNSTPHSFTSCELEPGEHGWLNITHSWQAGSVYRINILTERGTRAAEYHRAPLAG